jgi:tetratricopeptide (TPR) repeat protein
MRTSFLNELLAAFSLNRGAIEVTKASIGVDRPRAERDDRLADAERLLLGAMEQDPSNLAAYRNLAAVHAVQSQRSAARRLLDEAQTMTAPDDRHTLFQLGRLYRDNGDVSKAIDAWVRAGATRQLVAWGSTALRRGQWKTATDVDVATIHLAPTERVPWQGLALALDKVSERPDVLLAMSRLAALYPDAPWPYLAVGDLFANDGDIQTAREWYARGLAMAPDEESFLSRMQSEPRDSAATP